MYKILILLVLSTTAVSQETAMDPRVAAKIEEIKAYETLEGVWEGAYVIKSAPRELLNDLAEQGVKETGVKVVLVKDQLPKVYFKHTSSAAWAENDGDVTFVPDQLGFHIMIKREGGVWLERYWLSFSQVAEHEANMTFL